MKKVLLAAITAMACLGLAACGSKDTLNGNYFNNDSGMQERVYGKSSAKTVYLRTETDGVKKLKVKNGKYSYWRSALATKQTIELANNSKFDDEVTVKSDAVKPLANYSDFTEQFNDDVTTLSDDVSTLPDDIRGFHTLDAGSGVGILINVDDDKLLGFGLTAKTGNTAITPYLTAMAYSFNADIPTILDTYKKSTKQRGEYLTATSQGIKYTFQIKDGNTVIFVHKK